MNLDKETGVSVMKIAEQLDTGPVCNTYKIDLENNLNAHDVSDKLSLIAAEKLLDNIDDILEDKAKFIDQDHSKATYAFKIQKAEGEINWNDEAKNAKLQNIVKTITLYDDVGPDIIFFQEVENKNILKQLFLLLSTYGYVDFDLIEGNDYRGIDNAYLSKYKIQKTKQHKIIFSPEELILKLVCKNEFGRIILSSGVLIFETAVSKTGDSGPADVENRILRFF